MDCNGAGSWASPQMLMACEGNHPGMIHPAKMWWRYVPQEMSTIKKGPWHGVWFVHLEIPRCSVPCLRRRSHWESRELQKLTMFVCCSFACRRCVASITNVDRALRRRLFQRRLNKKMPTVSMVYAKHFKAALCTARVFLPNFFRS
jgi:hypothetical protein